MQLNTSKNCVIIFNFCPLFASSCSSFFSLSPLVLNQKARLYMGQLCSVPSVLEPQFHWTLYLENAEMRLYLPSNNTNFTLCKEWILLTLTMWWKYPDKLVLFDRDSCYDCRKKHPNMAVHAGISIDTVGSSRNWRNKRYLQASCRNVYVIEPRLFLDSQNFYSHEVTVGKYKTSTFKPRYNEQRYNEICDIMN